MTNQIDQLIRLATTLPVASLGSQQSYIEAVEALRTALEAALKPGGACGLDGFKRSSKTHQTLVVGGGNQRTA